MPPHVPFSSTLLKLAYWACIALLVVSVVWMFTSITLTGRSSP